MNALIVNSRGLGDGIIEIPFLKGMEMTAPHIRYFHTEGLLFQQSHFLQTLRLHAHVGTVPARWRKFYRSDWLQILTFMNANKIKLVINLRHLGPDYDSGYFNFKAQYGGDFTFLNYDFDIASITPMNIRDRIGALLQSSNVIDDSLDRHYLRRFTPVFKKRIPSRIVINIHAGNMFKRWPIGKWRALCENLIMRGCTLSIFSGYTLEEKALSAALFKYLDSNFPQKTELVASTDVISSLEHLSRSECLITGDSWPVHAASGIGVRTIGLYIVTSSIKWGGEAQYSSPVESHHLQRCKNYDQLLGICRNHYVNCPLIEAEGDGIDVSDVLNFVEKYVPF